MVEINIPLLDQIDNDLQSWTTTAFYIVIGIVATIVLCALYKILSCGMCIIRCMMCPFRLCRENGPSPEKDNLLPHRPV